MRAQEFRGLARGSLAGSWPVAIGTGLVAMLLGGNSFLSGGSGGGSAVSNTVNSASEYGYDYGYGYGYESLFDSPAFAGILAVLASVLMVLAVYSFVVFIIGGVVKLGYCQFNIDVVRKDQPVRFGTLFSKFSGQFGQGFVLNILIGLFTTLWLLAPTIVIGTLAGVIAFAASDSAAAGTMAVLVVILLCIALVPYIFWVTLRYAMAPYIAAQNPQMGARECLTRSKQLMRGNKWRLFCLQISFIGWQLLSVITFGILMLVYVGPYMAAAEAAFYLELTGQLPQQGGYAGGYPPNGGYPPQGGYPQYPQQGDYAPPQGGYPQQPGGYPPQQQGYGYPPPPAGVPYDAAPAPGASPEAPPADAPAGDPPPPPAYGPTGTPPSYPPPPEM